MKKTLFFFFIAVANFAFGQTQDFEQYLIKHKDWKESSNTEWEVSLSTPTGSLLYVGAEHADEPENKQFEKIKRQWTGYKPTLAFYEGPDRGIASSDTLTIKKFGESGYVRYLAMQSGIKVQSLEPATSDLYNFLIAKFSQEQVDLYMLSKEAMRLRSRKDLNKEQLTTTINKMLVVAPQLLGREMHIKSVEQLALLFRQSFGAELEWWQAPESWFDPQLQDNRVTNRLAVCSTEYRDIYMVKVLSQNVLKGERVFAVVGRNHVPLQIKALKYNLGLLKTK